MEYTKVCEHCGQSFKATRSDARFCSAICRTNTAKGKPRPEAMGGTPPKVLRMDEVGITPSDFSEILKRLDRIIELGEVQAASREQYLTARQVMELLSVNRTTIDRYVKDGILKPYRLSGADGADGQFRGKVYYKRSDIDALFA